MAFLPSFSLRSEFLLSVCCWASAHLALHRHRRSSFTILQRLFSFLPFFFLLFYLSSVSTQLRVELKQPRERNKVNVKSKAMERRIDEEWKWETTTNFYCDIKALEWWEAIGCAQFQFSQYLESLRTDEPLWEECIGVNTTILSSHESFFPFEFDPINMQDAHIIELDLENLEIKRARSNFRLTLITEWLSQVVNDG